MQVVEQWAREWGVPAAALQDLCRRLTTSEDRLPSGASEARAQQEVRLEASQAGARMWRNNVGAYKTDDGGLVRYGLCNESQVMNQHFKSADLIGITPREIGGRVVGVFTSIEVKRPGWKYTGAGREAAQMQWAIMVQSLGGLASFSTGEFNVL